MEYKITPIANAQTELNEIRTLTCIYKGAAEQPTLQHPWTNSAFRFIFKRGSRVC
jgi:hypothetical protein